MIRWLAGLLGARNFGYLEMRRLSFKLVLAISAMLGTFPIAAVELRAQDSPQTQAQTPPTRADDTASPPANDPEAMLPHFKDTRFCLSGQTNFIFQAHPDFHAANSGPNSVSRHFGK